MVMIGELYTLWGGALIFFFQRMMYDKRYRYWLRYFQIPMERTPKELKLVGYSREKLAKFWEMSSKLQSIVLKTTLFNSIFTMSLCSMTYLIAVHRRYSGKLHSPPVFWLIFLVSFLSVFIWKTSLTKNFIHVPGELCFVSAPRRDKLNQCDLSQPVSVSEYETIRRTLRSYHQETGEAFL